MSVDRGKTSTGMQANFEALLCYVGMWLTGIIFFLIEKENRFVRFHAMQSLVTFGALHIIATIIVIIPFLGWLVSTIIWVLSIILWVVLMLKAYQGEMYKLPYVGDFAEKQIGPSGS